MTWLRRYHLRHYVANSIWLMPSLGMVVALAAARALHRAEEVLGLQSSLDADTARAVLGTLASSMFTFVVFVCSALLVAVQLASAQLTPRIIALVFNDRGTRFALTLFVFTFTFTLAVLVRVNTSVPLLTAEAAAYGCLIDQVGKTLRPSGAVRMVAVHAREVIERVYPRLLAGSAEGVTDPADLPFGGSSVTVPCREDGVVLAFDVQGLLTLASRADCTIELVPRVGDFIAAGDPLFRVYPAGAAVVTKDLDHSVAVAQERTLEQDPAFAFRILVDIASKGLSPAINDPTTAVLVIDQIHHLLKNVGGRHLDSGRVLDGGDRVRLVYRTPDREDFVLLAVTAIRQFGGQSIQVVRRLRAMLENLIRTLPEARADLLRRELMLINRAAERAFPEAEDRALAGGSDLQGVGG